MIKKAIPLSIIFLFFLSVYNSYIWSKDQAPFSMMEKPFEDKVLNHARTLILQRKADEAISVLTNDQGPVRNDFDYQFLLAEAYLEKCSQMQEVMDVSGKTYQDLVTIPYNIGRQIMTQYKHYNNKMAYGSYICAKSFLLNKRPQRARKYSDYAIDMSLSPDAIFFILKADVLAEDYCRTISASKALHSATVFKNDIDESSSQYQDAVRAYEQVTIPVKNNLIRSCLYYKMGVFEFNIAQISKQSDNSLTKSGARHSSKAEKYFNLALPSADNRTKTMSYYYLGIIQTDQGNKEKARKAFSSAMGSVADSKLKKMIQEKLNEK